METSWLEEKFNDSITQFSERMQQLVNSDKPALYYHPIQTQDHKSASDLFKHLVAESHDKYYIKETILVLLSHFFQGLFHQPPVEVGKSNLLHYAKMKTVEDILIKYINSDLPSISSIAKEVALSESSLKRNFKTMFGISLYEYYLQRKMEFARIQLIEKKLPVKEVAYMLGYENSGSFIRIFKKHYQIAPGLLQKENK